MKFLIRNDDVAFDTDIDEIIRFCVICDKHGYRILQAVTPIGEVRKIKSAKMTNDQIRAASGKLFSENKEVLEYLKGRHDLIGVHGLWHTHKPNTAEIKSAKSILQEAGLAPTYFVPPFNEGDYPAQILGLKTCKLSQEAGQRLEDFLDKGTPQAVIMYLHSWRFNSSWYTFDMLDKCLQRLESSNSTKIKLNLGCKHRKLSGFDNLDKIFGWLFQDGLPEYADGTVDGITISHALMFLTTSELTTFMKEAWRVLKVDGVIRITEDDTENPQSDMYGTGCIKSGPRCLTGPKMMRGMLKGAGFKVYDVDQKTTHFYDRSLMQAYRGGPPKRFFIEAIKKTPDSESGDELIAYMSSSLRGNRGLKSAEDAIEGVKA